jgi:hypothetical protein
MALQPGPLSVATLKKPILAAYDQTHPLLLRAALAFRFASSGHRKRIEN